MNLNTWTKLWDRYLRWNSAATIGELQAAKDRGHDYLKIFAEGLKLEEDKIYD